VINILTVSNIIIMHQFFKSTFFNFEFIRILSASPFGGAEIAECLQAAGQIKNDDPESWHRAWNAQAEKAAALAKEALISGDVVSARRAFFRASNYFRASGYMFNDRPQTPDARVLPIAEKVIDHFKRGAKLLDSRVFFLEIPFEDSILPAYLYVPPTTKRTKGKIPVLINVGGADSIQEELYYVYAATGPDLGYAILTFDGPGQGVVLRREKLHMRPDWDFVIGKVLDYFTSFSLEHADLELDMERLAIAGSSMGGYYALRAAADPRVRACVSIDPFYDMWDFATQHISPTLINSWRNGWIFTNFLDGMIEMASRFSFQMKWEVNLARWFFGVETPTDTLLEMRKYTLKLDDGTSFLNRVRCPVLVSGAAQSLYLEPGTDVAKVLGALEHLNENQKKIWIAKDPEEGGLQAKIGAISLLAQRTFEFLDEHLGTERSIK
jgi:pimeloyl-ACP methyl ester carboxylesterase